MLALPLLLLIGSGGAVLERAGFAPLPTAPSRADFRCGSYSLRDAWSVVLVNGELRVRASENRTSSDPLPFSYAPAQDRNGDRHVLELDDGWLVGFDDGEFGGGLWWFGPDGKRSLRLRLPADAPAHKNDIFRAENVHGFARLANDVVVFMGLDHLGGRSGRIMRVSGASAERRLEPLAELDASPVAWVEAEATLFVLTQSGLWHVSSGGGARKSHDVDLGGLYSDSLAMDGEGTLYAGMRRYVLQLNPRPGGWDEAWFVRADCVRARVERGDCRCLP